MAALEMQVEQVTLDPVLGAPVVVLREKNGDRAVPIWVGQTEAAAIVSELRRVPMTRPSSHDLMKEMIFRLRASVSRVTVTDLRNGTFYAEVALRTPHGCVCLDSRPSDAIALALRVRSPIFVEQDVMERAWGAQVPEDICDGCDDSAPSVLIEPCHALHEGLLEGLADEEFGKWKM